ncbi:MAG: hypothetical protein R2932_27005 [Caldilineaceae bacterium]
MPIWISQATGSQGRLLFPQLALLFYCWSQGSKAGSCGCRGSWLLALWLAPPLLLVGSSLFALVVLFPVRMLPVAIDGLPDGLDADRDALSRHCAANG